MGSAPLFIENGSLSYFFPMLFPLKKEKKTEQLKYLTQMQPDSCFKNQDDRYPSGGNNGWSNG